MVCQNLSAVLSRRFRVLGGVLLPALLVLWPASSQGVDFRILMVREAGVDQATGRPSGQLVMSAGFADGIQEGMTGLVWRKNKYKGQLEVADFTVVAVTAEDATCKYVVRVPDFQVMKKDRVAVTPSVPAEADILARGMEALDKRQCVDALLYFDKIFCLSRENAFVQMQISQCLTQVQTKLAGGCTAAEKQLEKSRQWQDLELAEGHHAVGNDLAADLYLRRVLAVDSTLPKAVELRDSIPTQDLGALFSAERCQ